MATRQTFHGILQFIDQDALKTAMDIVQTEAPGAENLGLQDFFLAEGIMLFDRRVHAPETDWQEMVEAIGILSENASRGYVKVATGSEKVEVYQAGGDFPILDPEPDTPELEEAEDYFPILDHKRFHLKGDFGRGEFGITWVVHPLAGAGSGLQIFSPMETSYWYPAVNRFWLGDYYLKHGEYVYAVNAPALEIAASPPQQINDYAHQLIYKNKAIKGDVTINVWEERNIFRIYTVEGFETVNLPYGTLENCMKVQVDTHFTDSGPDGHVACEQFFAKGLGLVKVRTPEGNLDLVSVDQD